VVAAAYTLLLVELIALPVPSEASSLQQARARQRLGSRIAAFVPTVVVVLLYLAPLLWVVWPHTGAALGGWRLRSSLAQQLIALALISGGSGLTLWSTLLLRRASGVLLTDGPFAVSRHPGITGLAMLYAGVVTLIPGWVVLIGWLAYIAHMSRRAAIEEHALVGQHGPLYHTYRRRVGRLLPRLRRHRRVPIAVFASGAGSNLRALVEAAATPHFARAQICCVVGNHSRSGALAYARDQGLAVFHASSRTHPDEPSLAAHISSILHLHRIELVLLAGYTKLLPAPVVAAFRDRILNLHPALLPKHGGRGMYGLAPHQAVLDAGESESGITVHWVTEEYDEGRPLLQLRLPVAATDSAISLQRRVAAVEHASYWRAVNLAIDLIEAARGTS